VSKKEDKKSKKAKGAQEAVPEEPAPKAKKQKSGPSEPSRMKVHYSKDVVPAVMKHFKYTNVMAVPKLEKIVINMGLGEAIANAKIIDVATDELGRISGQRPVVTKAKKSIANFKLRQNMPIGAAVTLRGARMWEFMDRFITIAIPRIRDFRGVNTRSFDGRGNYSLGVKEQMIFPEINYDMVEQIHGFDITFVTTAKRDDHALALLKELGMPFRGDDRGGARA